MLVSAVIIMNSPLLNTVRRHLEVDRDPPVLTRFRRHGRKFDGVQRRSRVPSRHVSQELPGFFREVYLHAAEPPVFIRDSPVKKDCDLLLRERMQLKDRRS